MKDKSDLVLEVVESHVQTFGGFYEMRDDLGVVVYQDHDSHDLKLFTYDEYLEHTLEVKYG
jgi:hypothetical protein